MEFGLGTPTRPSLPSGLQLSHLLLPISVFFYTKVPLLHGHHNLVFSPSFQTEARIWFDPWNIKSRSMEALVILQEASKMPWSIDTTLSLISLFITGSSSLLAIWDRVIHGSKRISFKGQPGGAHRAAVTNPPPDSSTETLVSRGLHRPRNVDPGVLLESGLYTQSLQPQLVCHLLKKGISFARNYLTLPRISSQN
jgi:hypothetical protein